MLVKVNLTRQAIEPETKKQILQAIETVGPNTMTILKDTADGVFGMAQSPMMTRQVSNGINVVDH